ncbi:ABC transporter ATP-binding protein [Advenella mimigardefordensis]|uniref:High-affinity branched-chain amino acid transport ATP-binding protein n=1 Tax=Advenella mimigardefordensis (strain DSM 17166 / LMG 22922 / DPN7) TaxID=1247726 RepID=W0P9S5_ADVMD|nr:ABC transporter ATP-binding protein [Advenella mimigardefordensis]AHG63486.1 high-affinity branched-chain amino acid transport ATP-binding protein [Advenella mimigardefordensis DPN7]
MTLLEVRNLSVSYGGVAALSGVSVSVPEKGVVAVVGANGAGKSTLLKSIAGVVHTRNGQIVLEGSDIVSLKPHERLDRGLALCPEGRRLFPEMTVFDNIKIGAYRNHNSGQFRQRLDMLYDIFPRIAERRHQVASSLSGGEQQMVAIARALISQPRILMLDEPTLGLAPKMILEVARLVQTVSAEGIAVVMVEQNAKLALRISNYGYVLETGELRLEGASAELMKSDHVVRAYLGG